MTETMGKDAGKQVLVTAGASGIETVSFRKAGGTPVKTIEQRINHLLVVGCPVTGDTQTKDATQEGCG